MTEVKSPKLRVGFILTPRFTLSALANFVDVLRLAADEGDRSRPIRCEWHILSCTRHPVRSSSGIEVQPDASLSAPRAYDYIVVVGGLLDEQAKIGPEYVSFLREAAAMGIPLVGLCTGAFLLHEAGLLDGYKCCVSWFHHEDFLEQFDGLTPVSDQIFVADRDRLTCSGGASSAHLAAFLVDRHIGRAAAQKSLHIMIIDEAQVAENPQPGLPLELSTRDQLVRRALLRMQQRLESPYSTDELAATLGVSKRKLERHFQNTLRLTPHAAALRIRLAQAKMLIERTDRTIADIANSTGFCDASHFSRVFSKEEGLPPADYRLSRRQDIAAKGV